MSLNTLQRKERLINEVSEFVFHFINIDNTNEAREIAKEIIKTIDWNDKAMMHKGLSWITKNYLEKHYKLH